MVQLENERASFECLIVKKKKFNSPTMCTHLFVRLFFKNKHCVDKQSCYPQDFILARQNTKVARDTRHVIPNYREKYINVCVRHSLIALLSCNK